MDDPAADKENLAAADARGRQGMTNRSAAEEDEEQRQLPPRGEAKADSSPQDR